MASKPHNWSEITDSTGTSNSGLTRQSFTRARWLWRALFYSSTYLALIAVAEVLVVRQLLSLPPTPAPFVVGLITFAVYANDRLVDLDTDEVSSPRRTAFVRRHRRTLYVLSAMAYGLAVAISVFGGPIAFALALLPGATWVVYACRWNPTAMVPFARFKEILFLNSLLVAGAWSLTVVFLPLAFAGVSVGPTVALIFGYFVLATFVNTEIANVGDVESDEESGVATFPVRFGIAWTRRVLCGMVALTALGLGAAHLGGYLSLLSVGALSLGLGFLFAVSALVGHTEKTDTLAFAAECTRLPVFALLAFAPLL